MSSSSSSLSLYSSVGGGESAESADLKTFDSQEGYVAEGTTIVLAQVAGEAAVKFRAASQVAESANTLTAASGESFSHRLELPGGQALYELQTNGGPASAAESAAAVASLNSDTNIAYAYPVYVNQDTGNRVFLNDEIVVRFKTSAALQNTNLSAPFKLKLVNRLSESDNIYVLQLSDPKNFNPFKVCNAIRVLPDVLWAEPNFAQETSQFVIPNDTQFSSQWHLRNTGQSGGTSDADVDADDAWGGSQGYGSSGIRIAIIDDGVQTTHPDLSANIVQGYDFYSGDSDPSPGGTYNNHGTAVAGVAAAAVNNSLGVAGVAGKSQILPVRLLNTYDAQGHALLPNAATVYRALLYAADNADIINCSWGGLSPDSTISAGFSYASAYGRNGYGCTVFCSSGNGASGWFTYTLSGFPAGNYTFDWLYSKDAGGSAGDDTAWLDSVVFPGGSVERFEGTTLPSGWTATPGSATSWSSVQDGASGNHALIAWNGEGSRSVRAGTTGNNQYSGLRVTKAVAAGDLTFRVWVSSQAGADGWILYVNNSPYFSGSGVPTLTTSVTYPASLSSVFAIGASSDFDYRADFSQYDSTLDFVAPGGGGSGGIATTDRTGTDGYVSGDYNTGFGGTSASAPLAAGIAALVLSKDGKQSASTVASKLDSTCDKVGSVSYSGSPYTRNDYYGFGRLNANAAVGAVTADTTSPTFVSATVVNYRAVDVEFGEPMGDGALDPNNYSITAGQGTLSSHPNKVLRIGPVLVGYNLHYGTYRLIWNSGDMASSGTVTIQAASSIKDVAGNALTGTLSRSGTGTKRVLAVDCGSLESFSYKPPYLSDNGFQANEPAPFLTSSGTYQQTDYTYVDTSGVSDPAPQAVYQSWRGVYDPTEQAAITYSLPNLPSGNLTVRVHINNVNDIYGYEVFDIYVNGSYKSTFYGGGSSYTAYVLEYANITAQSGAITVSVVPQQSYYDGAYRAAISGLEIVKP